MTNLQAAVVMHNTTNLNGPYEIFSTTNLATPMSNWISESIWIAHATNTPANIDVGDRTNQNFFRARLWNGQFTYGIPRCGELFLLLPDTNAISAVVNGVTNAISPFYSNWAMTRLPSTNGNILQTYSFNAGYDHSDSGPTNWLSDFPQQNIRAFVGFSSTASNVALSYNAITNIDVRGWPKLFQLECFHTANLTTAKITNCPSLNRICFESLEDETHGLVGTLDLTGCANIADLRAANNGFTNIVLANGAGSNIWHFCIRQTHNGNIPRVPYIAFSELKSLEQLWIWNCYLTQPLIVTHTNCPYLSSVEADANYFSVVDVHGQTNLDHIFLVANTTLTNLNITGCSNLTRIDAQDCGLTSSAVDSVLVNFGPDGNFTCQHSRRSSRLSL